jgi:hypothetical protein
MSGPRTDYTAVSDDTYCQCVEDVFTAAARQFLAQIARAPLAAQGLTVTEVLHSVRRFQQVSQNDSLFGSLLQRVAIVQVRRTRRPVGERLKELTLLAEDFEQELRQQEKQLYARFDLGSDIDADAILRCETMLTIRPARLAVVRLLERVSDWPAKLDALIDLQRRARGQMLKDIVGELLVEVLAADAATEALLGASCNLQKITNALHLLDGNAALMVLPSAAKPRAFALSGLLRQAGFAEVRDVLEARVKALLGGPAPMASTEANAEFIALQMLYLALQQHASFAGDEAVFRPLSARISRLLASETIDALAGGDPHAGPRLLQALALYERVNTEAAITILNRYVRRLADAQDFAAALSPPDQREDMLRRIYAAVDAARMPQSEKGPLLLRLQALGGNVARAPSRSKAGPEDAVYIGETRIPLLNWGPAGLVFGPLPKEIAAGRYMKVTVRIRNPFITIGFETEADVVRVEGGIVTARYEVWDNEIDRRIRRYFNV